MIKKSLYDYFKIIKLLSKDDFYNDYIVIKGSTYYLNFFKDIKRFPSDVDFCLALNCDVELKKKIIRGIIARCSKDVVLCENLNTPNQFGLIKKNNTEIRIEANAYSPINRPIIKIKIKFEKENVKILAYPLETIIVDKIFSLFYFVHPLYNGKQYRLYEVFYDVGIMVKSKRGSKLLKSKKIYSAIKNKLEENLFGLYGLPMYIDFFDKKFYYWKICDKEIAINYREFCLKNNYDNYVDFSEIIEILDKIKRKCLEDKQIKKLIKTFKTEALI